MTDQHEQLQALREIRSIMDRSARFQSLSGLSGILVGLLALAGAGAATWYLSGHGLRYTDVYSQPLATETATFLLAVAATVLLLATTSVLYITHLKSRKAGQSVWNSQGQRLLLNFCLPLAVGGLFCFVLMHHGLLYLLAPTTLLFYGLAVVNSSKYTYSDLRSLGVLEVALGLLSSFWVEYGLLAWTLGFGLLHLFYGAIIYFKYDKASR
jgi:hypothetical protein